MKSLAFLFLASFFIVTSPLLAQPTIPLKSQHPGRVKEFPIKLRDAKHIVFSRQFTYSKAHNRIDKGSSFGIQSICEDDLEPNDAVATLINGPIYQNNALCLSKGDRDWFYFTFLEREYFILVQGYDEEIEGEYGLLVQMEEDSISIETISVGGIDPDTYISLYLYDNSNERSFRLVSDDNGAEGLFSRLSYLLKLPDLVISDGYLDKDNLFLSGSITIMNIGSRTSKDVSKLHFSLGDELEVSYLANEIRDYDIPILGEFEQVEIPFSFDVLTECNAQPCAPPGRYTLHVDIDLDGESGEKNINNNFNWFPNTVIVVPNTQGILCADTLEPNNTRETATQIPQIPFHQDNLCLTPGDRDNFRFQIGSRTFYCSIEQNDPIISFTEVAFNLSIEAQGDTIEIQVVSVGGTDLDFYIFLYEFDGNRILDLPFIDSERTANIARERYSLVYPILEATHWNLKVDGSILSGNITVKNISTIPTYKDSEVAFSMAEPGEEVTSLDEVETYKLPIINPLDSIQFDFRIDLIADCPEKTCFCPGTYNLYFWVSWFRTQSSTDNILYQFTEPEIFIPETGAFDESCLDIIYVDSSAVSRDTEKNGSSWATAFTNLQDALEIADNGDEIWLAKGTYYPVECTDCRESDRETSFKINSFIKIFGGFSGTESSLQERDPDSTGFI